MTKFKTRGSKNSQDRKTNVAAKSSKALTYTTKLFPSTGCHPAYVQMMAREAAANGLNEILPENTGYVLVNKRLVPYTLLRRLRAELEGSQFDYGFVLSEATIFSADFLLALDADEREVLMPCVLILIERGDFGLNLFASVDEEAAA